MKNSEAITEIQSLELKVEEARQALVKRRERFAEENCPIQPGDITTVEGPSYQPHKGKDIIVSRVGVKTRFRDKWVWVIWGKVFNKNGEPGKLVANFELEVDLTC